jgi:hypothetical protein
MGMVDDLMKASTYLLKMAQQLNRGTSVLLDSKSKLEIKIGIVKNYLNNLNAKFKFLSLGKQVEFF